MAKKKKRKGTCYCTKTKSGMMVCSRSKKHTRRLASRMGRKSGGRYGKVFRAAAGNC